MRKQDIKLSFDKKLIPAMSQMLQQEEDFLQELKAYPGLIPDNILDRMIDLSMDTIRLYRERLQECKKYSSELK